MALINIDKEKCNLSYACVRICPVNAIKVEAHQDYPEVISNTCIGCGHCLKVCSPGAISYSDSREETKTLLNSKNKVAAICGPSISGEFHDITDYRKFVEMIRALGFDYVLEASFGVDLVARKYHELFTGFKGKYYISANCPSVVSYIEKFHPELTENLAPIVSPMGATAKVARKKYGKDLKVVYIGPCIETKKEGKKYRDDGRIDSVLTFSELRELFAEFKITEKKVELSDFDPPIGYKGSIYPISTGILEASGIDQNLLSGNVITAEGRNNMLEAVRQFEKHIDSIKKHFNLFYNEGCIMGPGTSGGGDKYLRHALVVDYAKKRLSDFDMKEWEAAMDEFSNLDLSRKFKKDDQRLPYPDEDKIQEILQIIGKEHNVDEIGCASCGYTSCRDFAVAVAQGLAKTEMCLTFTLKNRHDYIKTLRDTNQKLAETQAALKKSEKNARRDQQLARESFETTRTMLEKLPSSIVLVDNELKVIQANKSFINILDEEVKMIEDVIPGLEGADLKTLLPYNFHNLFSYVLTNDDNIVNRDVHFNDILYNVSIFTIRKNKIVGAVIRDLYVPEVRKEEVIKRVTDVIDKNLELVQKIGFLLGEGASETEAMLNSIIESYQMPQKPEKNG
ncbi:MAG: [Fe-Fe] hydrogenase large subunit C-terminal domain-containing protein [Bacteroidales bacterium]